MDEMEQLQHGLYARTVGFQRKVERARSIIDEALSLPLPDGKRWYCAWSTGVDSSVMLDLIAQVPNWQEKVDVQYGDDGADFPETIQCLEDVPARYGFRLRRIRNVKSWREWCIEMGRPDIANDLSAWLNPPMLYDAVWHTWEDRIIQSPQYGGLFLGILACESNNRSYVLHNGHKPLYQVKRESGMWHCCPLAAFSKRDVWAYVVSREMPYNPVYDNLAELGIPLERRRVAPLTCLRVLQYGSMARVKQQWPSLFNQLAAIFPKVREYT